MKAMIDNSEYDNLIQALAVLYENLFTVDIESHSLQTYAIVEDIRENYGKAIANCKYEDVISMYINAEVHRDDIYLFDTIRTVEGCKKLLEKDEKHSFVYRVIRNGCIHYLRFQLVKISDESNIFALAFRYVDDEIQAYIKSRKESKRRMDIIQSIGNIYTSLYFVDLKKDTFEELSAIPKVHKVIRSEGSASERLDFLVKNIVGPEYRDAIKDFVDLTTLRERLKGIAVISREFYGSLTGWSECSFIPIKGEDSDEIEQVIFATREINKEKSFELQQEKDLQNKSDKIKEYNRIIDDIAKKEEEHKEELERQYSVSVGLSQEYHAVWLCPRDGRNMQLFRVTEKYSIQNAVDMGLQYKDFNTAIKHYIDAYVDENDRERVWNSVQFEKLDELIPENGIYTVNYLRHTDEGTSGYHQMAFARAVRKDGRYDYIIAYRDIDKMVKEEQEKQRALQDALVSAEHANKAKTTFLTNMSHDIRTPMNAIMGFAKLALTHIEDHKKMQDYLGKISTSGDLLLSLINDILDMTRIESGKMKLDNTECNLLEIIHDLENIIQSDIKKKNISFYIDIVDVTDELVICDKLRLNQILLNLVGNSLKFTPPGGNIWLKLFQRSADDKTHHLYEFHVKDSGIGMSQEFLEHIFEPFERERTSTVSGIQGTGLGMAITRNIIDMMGGEITVSSEKGVGTEIIFTIPMSIANSVDGQEEKRGDTQYIQRNMEDVQEYNSEQSGRHYGKRLLLVEDNELNREIATEVLEEVGMIVESAENGQVAIDMLLSNEPGYYQLVLMDIQMPVMDGYEAARRIRALENQELAAVPIVAMTANAFEEDKKMAFDAGMDGHIAKPVNIKIFFELLSQVL